MVAAAAVAHGDPLPKGAIGPVVGAVAGTGADAKQVGAGYYQFGLQASWQPMRTERPWGYTLRWGTMFGRMYGGQAAKIDASLQTVQMDATAGVRFRPWTTPTRYLTARIGGEILRTNEPIPPTDHRSFVGGVALAGFDQYIAGFLVSVDVRYGLIPNGPGELALLIGLASTGP